MYSFNQNILALFIHIIEYKEIDIKTYKETYGIQRHADYGLGKYLSTDEMIFNYLMNTIHKIMDDLKINIHYYTIQENKSIYYYYYSKDKFIKYSYEQLDIKTREKYKYIIVYIMLVQNRFISSRTLSEIFGDVMTKYKLKYFKQKLNEVVEIEYRIKTRSYHLIKY